MLFAIGFCGFLIGLFLGRPIEGFWTRWQKRRAEARHVDKFVDEVVDEARSQAEKACCRAERVARERNPDGVPAEETG